MFSERMGSAIVVALSNPARDLARSATLDIYSSAFGLTERPFSLVPDPGFLYWSPLHQRAFAILEYGILTRAPITLITGAVGTGKTTLLHHLLDTFGQGVTVGMIANAQGDRNELLRWILLALGQHSSPGDGHVDLFDRFQQFLISEYAAGRRVILIFDEAQNLTRHTLEELRMFTNINANKDELLQLVLVGQPELRDMVRQPDLTQFAQRISAAFHLEPLNAATSRAYIRHRLAIAGARRSVFSRAACDLIHTNTGGVPRLLNQLCDLAMVYAFARNVRHVSVATVTQVLQDGTFFAALPRPQIPDVLQLHPPLYKAR